MIDWVRNGSVVKCLTRDWGAAGSSLAGVTVLCPWLHINPFLVLVQPRKMRPYITERLLMWWDIKNQIKQTNDWIFVSIFWTFILECNTYRGSYMSAHVLLNLSNELRKTDKMRGLPSILSRFRIKVSKGAKIKNRYNQVPHLTQDTNGKVTNSQ